MLLSDETRREFVKRGYIVVPAVLSPQEVGAAMIVVDDFVAQTMAIAVITSTGRP
jgi:hypothetical protein